MSPTAASDAPECIGVRGHDDSYGREAAGHRAEHDDGGGPAPAVAQAEQEGAQPAPVLARLGIAAGGGFFHDRKLVWKVLQRYPVFRRYFIGSLVSNFGSWLQTTAQVLLVYRLTKSVFDIGVLTAAQFLVPLLFGSWAGAFANRFGSKRTLIWSQLLSAVVAAILACLQWHGGLTEKELVIGALFTGFFTTFSLPAQSAIAGALVRPDGKDDETNGNKETVAAMSMNSVSYNAGRALAPVFSVLIVTMIGFAWAFAINAISFAAFLAILIRVQCTPPTERSPVMQGIRIALAKPRILMLLLMVAFITLADDPVLVLGPALAHHVFHQSVDWSGYFSCALGCGSVLGSLLPRQAASARRAATALAILGGLMVGFVYMPKIWMSVFMAFAAGVACLVASSTLQALLYQLGGKKIAAQMMGFWTVAWAGSKPIASIIDGWLPSQDHIGYQLTGVLMALPTFLPLLILIFGPTKLVSWCTEFRLLSRKQEQPA